MPHKNTLFAHVFFNLLSQGCFLIGMGTSLALWAHNATFDSSTGTLHIPTVEVPQVFGTGLDYYQVDLGLVPESSVMTFTLLNAVLMPSSTTTPNIEDPTTGPQVQILSGTWTFSYKILNDYTDSYTLTTVKESTTEPGKYYIFGTNEYGDSVVAEYNSEYKSYALFDKRTLFDQYFTFNFTSEDTVSGCYYLVTVETSESSECYNMTGIRTARTSYRANSLKNSLEEEQHVVGEHRALQAAKRSVPWIQVKDTNEETYKRYKPLQEAISSQVRSKAQ
jgi:hypothetical protein